MFPKPVSENLVLFSQVLLCRFIIWHETPEFSHIIFLCLSFSDRSGAYTWEQSGIRTKCALTESETATWMKLSRMDELSWSMTSIIGLSSSCTKGGQLVSMGRRILPTHPTAFVRYMKQNSLQDSDKSFLIEKWVPRWWKVVDKIPCDSEFSFSSFSGRRLELQLHIVLKRHGLELQKVAHVREDLNTCAIHHPAECSCCREI